MASLPLPEDKTEARLRVGHILAVTRTQAAFVAGARKAGDECRPLDFLPEVYHRYGEGRDGAVIADGLLHYTAVAGGRRLCRAFVEVDRGTMASEKLAAKLIGYARFREYHPIPPHLRRTAGAQSVLLAWQQHYVVFPRLLFALADTGERAARQRIRDLQGIADAHPLVARMLMTVKASAARLADLEQLGVGQVEEWKAAPAGLHARFASRFTRSEPQGRALEYMAGLIAARPRRQLLAYCSGRRSVWRQRGVRSRAVRPVRCKFRGWSDCWVWWCSERWFIRVIRSGEYGLCRPA
ncbi:MULTISPECIES: replication-relaxation family protein [unclassified Kitasatospora]|uniref:replication-relaxation family protein n=1 Tax=unclassified Kitasatospora TaxID=2633591 RepID=UPI0033E1B518